MLNISKDKAMEVDNLVKDIFNHNIKFACETPCTTTKYTTRLLQNVPHDLSVMVVVFDRTVDIRHSTFSISGQTLLTRLGGSVSSGRTLLWILITLLGATKETPLVIKMFSFGHCPNEGGGGPCPNFMAFTFTL